MTRVVKRKMEETDDVTAEIQSALQTINGAWLSANPAAARGVLRSCFHPDMVIKGCELTTMAEGRDACVDSYVDFIKQAKVSHFEQEEPDIRLFGNTAIASYRWRIVYTLDGQECDEKGGDIFAFLREGGKWLAVWRAMLN